MCVCKRLLSLDYNLCTVVYKVAKATFKRGGINDKIYSWIGFLDPVIAFFFVNYLDLHLHYNRAISNFIRLRLEQKKEVVGFVDVWGVYQFFL